jgi:hypothetical protein
MNELKMSLRIHSSRLAHRQLVFLLLSKSDFLCLDLSKFRSDDSGFLVPHTSY